jgi:hypothetical protein
MAPSGAWRAGTTYDFAGYQEWALEWLRHPAVDWCVIPDIIDGTEHDNDDLLEVWTHLRARAVPVWHLHESLQRLDRLVTGWPRVALGSSGTYRDPGSEAWWKRIAEAMKVACDRDGYPRAKLHGLRMLDPVLFSHLPLSSADSCNVARNVGIDSKWTGPFVPASPEVRATVIVDRIEHHGAARRWCPSTGGVQQNMELIG